MLTKQLDDADVSENGKWPPKIIVWEIPQNMELVIIFPQQTQPCGWNPSRGFRPVATEEGTEVLLHEAM